MKEEGLSEDAKYLKGILSKLAEKMSFKWRVQSFSKYKPEATCVAYIDARDAQQRLDDTCTYGWHRDHKEVKGHVYAGVGIVMPSGVVMWRWDCGVESNVDAEKGEASDSFKRAAVNWGIGRFLYDLKITRLPANEKKEQGKYPHVVDSHGKRVWDLTKHINGTDSRKEPPIPAEEVLDGAINAFLAKVKTGREVIGEDNYKKALKEYNVKTAEEIKPDLRKPFLIFMGKYKEGEKT